MPSPLKQCDCQRLLAIDLANVRLISDGSLGTMGGKVDSHLNIPGERDEPNGMSSNTARPGPVKEGKDKDTDDSNREEEPDSGKEPIAKMST